MLGAKDLKAGMPVDGVFLISNASIGTSKKGAPFLSFDARAKDGALFEGCKKWDTKDEYKGVIHLTGKVEEFNGKLQIIAATMEMGQGVIEEFLPKCPLDLDPHLLRSELYCFINNISCSYLKRRLSAFLDYWDQFSYPSLKPRTSHFYDHPGAIKIHHAYVHGLLHHTVEVLRHAIPMAKHQGFNKHEIDLLTFGATIHDIGKLDGYEIIDGAYQYSKLNKAYGWSSNAHLYIGSQMLSHFYSHDIKSEQKGNQLAIDWSEPEKNITEDEFMILQNILLSHHGPFGDVKPMTMIAETIHLADMMSSEMNRMQLQFAIKPEATEIHKDQVGASYLRIADY